MHERGSCFVALTGEQCGCVAFLDSKTSGIGTWTPAERTINDCGSH